MPYQVRKIRNKECYEVINTLTKKIHSKCTTRSKAESQIRLLRGIEHGMIILKKKYVK